VKRNIVERIRCIIEWDQPRRIEIFGNRRYGDYHIRGYLNTLDGSHFPSSNDDDFKPYKRCLASINYWFVITVLVNDRYQKRIRRARNRRDFRFWQDMEWVPEPMFETTTRKEYVDMKRRKLLARLKKWGRPRKSIHMWELDMFRGETVVVSLDEAGVKDSEYLSEAIGSKKDIIVLDMDFFVDKTDLGRIYTKKDYLKRTYAVPIFFYPLWNRRSEMDALAWWFDDLFDMLYFEADYHYMGKTEYARILESIGELGYKWIRRKSISDRDFKMLNRLKKRMGDRTYPLTNFCWKFFDDLIDDMATQRQIAECQFCGDLFKYDSRLPGKKFCSLKSEGKDCGKPARDHRYYETHKNKILTEARERRGPRKVSRRK